MYEDVTSKLGKGAWAEFKVDHVWTRLWSFRVLLWNYSHSSHHQQQRLSIQLSNMSRKSSRKTDNQVPQAERIETIATPKKGRKVEVVEAIATSPAKSTKKKTKIETEYQEENTEDSPKIRINRVKAKAALEDETASRPKTAPAKRKSKAVNEDEEDDEDAGEKKATKKRKTKEEKEAEAMPLAARTGIEGLKKAMRIGAHVSGAGGMFF